MSGKLETAQKVLEIASVCCGIAGQVAIMAYFWRLELAAWLRGVRARWHAEQARATFEAGSRVLREAHDVVSSYRAEEV